MYGAIVIMILLCGISPQGATAAERVGYGQGASGMTDEPSAEIRIYGRGDFDITDSRRAKGMPVITTDIWRGSRIGLKGRGTLASGFSIVGHVESGFGTKDGEFVLFQDKVFGRQAYAGVESPIGTVTFGRQYPVSDAVVSVVDIALPGLLSPYKSQFYWRIDELEKAVIYSSPAAGGLQARAGYAFGERAGAAGSSTATAGILFNRGRVEAGASLESWETSAFSTSSTVYNFWNLAASCDLGAAVLVAGLAVDDVNMDVSSTTAVRSRTYAAGIKIPTGAAGKVTILLQLVTPERHTAIEIGTLRYSHSLSRRIDLYSQINVANSAAANAYGVKSEIFIGAHYQFDLRLLGK
jgi:predicted porin